MFPFFRRVRSFSRPFFTAIRFGLLGSGTVLATASLNPLYCAPDQPDVLKRDVSDLPVLDYSKPSFSKNSVVVIFVIGGPGVGKGTQCSMLIQRYPDFVHLSAGDLLRVERNRPGSIYGNLINECIAEGRIVPMEITISLLEKEMRKSSSTRYLIDGFPRNIDQAIAFEKAVCPATALIFYECPEMVLEERLLQRGKSSGRVDDNLESIRKRFQTFIDATLPVLAFYKQNGVVRVINGHGSPDEVFEKSCNAIEELLLQV
jgi:UMP-CMP kinase